MGTLYGSSNRTDLLLVAGAELSGLPPTLPRARAAPQSRQRAFADDIAPRTRPFASSGANSVNNF